VVGPCLVRGEWFPSRLPLEGTSRIQIFWAVTDDPRYPVYKTTTVALEPSIEQVARAVNSKEGRIGTHMLLRVPPRDLVVRTWGESLHDNNSESHGGTHRVAREAVAELNAHAKAKFHMHYFILR
jgi:hypothetical protein